MKFLSDLWKKFTGGGVDSNAQVLLSPVTEETLEEQLWPFPSTAQLVKNHKKVFSATPSKKTKKQNDAKKDSKPRINYKWLNEVINTLRYNPMLVGEITTIPVPPGLTVEQINDTVSRKVKELFSSRVDDVTGKITFKHRGTKLFVQIDGVAKSKAKAKTKAKGKK